MPRKTRSDITIGSLEKKLGLKAGAIKNPDGTDARSDKKLGTLRKEYSKPKKVKAKKVKSTSKSTKKASPKKIEKKIVSKPATPDQKKASKRTVKSNPKTSSKLAKKVRSAIKKSKKK